VRDEDRLLLLDEGRSRPGQDDGTAARRLLARSWTARVRGRAFADRSGGLITFEAESLEAAERIITADPFVREELLEGSVVKVWIPQ
jgi:uncharacterized protein YciI